MHGERLKISNSGTSNCQCSLHPKEKSSYPDFLHIRMARCPWLIRTTGMLLDDLMTGKNYLDFVQNELPKQLEDVPLATRIAMYFQHAGATSHYTRHVLQHLNDIFPNRWIGRGSTINWPPRSPDLTPLDFCLWGMMKSEVYRKQSEYTRRTAR